MASSDKLLIAFRAVDSRFGVTRATVRQLAQTLGLNETQVIHFALRQLAKAELPGYAPDEGPLTGRELQAIQRAGGGRHGTSVRSSLF